MDGDSTQLVLILHRTTFDLIDILARHFSLPALFNFATASDDEAHIEMTAITTLLTVCCGVNIQRSFDVEHLAQQRAHDMGAWTKSLFWRHLSEFGVGMEWKALDNPEQSMDSIALHSTTTAILA